MQNQRQFYNRLIIKAFDDRFYESSGTTAGQRETDLEDAADKKLVQSHCHWKYSESEGIWDTACGNKFMLNDGTPSENRMRYCPYCGGVLVEEPLNNDRAWTDSVDEVMRS